MCNSAERTVCPFVRGFVSSGRARKEFIFPSPKISQDDNSIGEVGAKNKKAMLNSDFDL